METSEGFGAIQAAVLCCDMCHIVPQHKPKTITKREACPDPIAAPSCSQRSQNGTPVPATSLFSRCSQ
jgi:hypothetical protein